MESRVCGTVILYNPNPDVIDNIHSYLDQVEYLIVVDNSENINSHIVSEIKSLKKVNYVSFNENLGIAAALNIAAKIASENKYNFLLTMDQDSIAPSNLVSSLLEIALKNTNVGIVSPLHANKYGTHLKYQNDIEKVNIIMTSGNLLSLDAFNTIGKFNEDYFIDYVDIEYCLRMAGNEYNIYQLNNVVLDHNEASISERKFFNRKVHPHNHKPFRLYYKTRNILYLRKKYKNVFQLQLKKEYNSYLWTIARMVVYEKDRILKMKMVFLGIRDYLRGKKGRRF